MSEKAERRSEESKLSIQVDPQIAPGVYSNLMMISHRRDEFIFDFLFVHPQRSPHGETAATLRARVITSPGHAKRILRALGENIRRYEQSYGLIEEAPEMPRVAH